MPPNSQVMGDLDATVAWAAKTREANPSKLAITGFCWDGRIVWLYAAHNPNVKAGAAWYGPVIGQKDELRRKSVLDLAPEMKPPVIGFYGGKDQGIPVDRVEQLRAALKAAHKPCGISIYPDAQHGFNADYRPSYNETGAKEACAKMLVWFHKHDA